ncbi:MAG: hypothetical protein LBG99_09330 [Propionibacteriaceae bacterium]|jgi:hypothetical protein|nr:hypothetical protein [Propionibacteriaceae bacterium]
MKFRRYLVGVVVLVSGLMAGCTGSNPSEDTSVLAPNLRAFFQQFLDQPGISDFEREVFTRAVETGGITQEDYDEAFRRYASCMVDKGYHETYERRPDGLMSIRPPQSMVDVSDKEFDAYAQQMTDCADGTVMRIEAAYNDQLNNPGLLSDPYEIVVQCLAQSGLVDLSYTPEQFEQDLNSSLKDNAPFDPMDPQVQQCLSGAGIGYVTN